MNMNQAPLRYFAKIGPFIMASANISGLNEPKPQGSFEYGSSHEGVAVLLTGFAIKW